MNVKFDFNLRPTLIGPPGDAVKETISQRFGESGTAVFDAMTPLLDGRNSVADIYAKLTIANFDAETVSKALDRLDSLGLLAGVPAQDNGRLTEYEVRRHARQIELFDHWLGEDPAVSGPQTKGHQAQISLGNARVLLVGLDRAGSRLAKALAAAGVGAIYGISAHALNSETSVAEASEGLADEITSINPAVKFTKVRQPQDLPSAFDNEAAASLLIYCSDEFDQALCIQLNELALSTPVPFLIYRQTLSHIEIGPLIFPRETACYICCDLRRKGALSGLSFAELCPAPSCGFNFSIGVDLLALEVVKILTHVALPISRGKIWRLNLKTGLSEVHPVLKLPRCVACGVHRKTPFRKLWEA